MNGVEALSVLEACCAGEDELADINDVVLSGERGLHARIADTEQLAEALDAATNGVRSMIASAVEATERRCKEELQRAIEAASTSAVRSTEQLMKSKMEEEIKQAVAQARAEWEIEEQAAVSRAIKETEMRCEEEKRIAIQSATSAVNLEWGKSPEEIAAMNAAKTFEQATKAAGAALMAAQDLHMRVDSTSMPVQAPPPTRLTQTESKQNEELEFF